MVNDRTRTTPPEDPEMQWACGLIVTVWIVLAIAIGVFLHWVFTNV